VYENSHTGLPQCVAVKIDIVIDERVDFVAAASQFAGEADQLPLGAARTEGLYRKKKSHRTLASPAHRWTAG
jgi:hypothetical protein